LFIRYLSSWLQASDREILKGWYEGEVNPCQWKILRLPAMGAWSLFIVVMRCINVLLR